MGYNAKVLREGVHPIQIAHPLYMGPLETIVIVIRGLVRGAAFELIVKSKDSPLVGAITSSIYLRPTVTPRMRIPRLRGTPAGGARFFRPDVEGRSPEDSGLPMDPPIPHDPARVSH